MAKIFRQADLSFQENAVSVEHFRLQTVMPRLYQVVDSQHLVFDLRMLPPEQYSFPYHFHRNAEELVLVLSGSMIMRTPEGFKALNQGDLVFFEMGTTGAHQFYNQDPIPCTYLDIKTVREMDVCEYPDSGKVNIAPFGEIFVKDTQVDYFYGENKVQDRWADYKKDLGTGD
jgi:uncharacterized cupin superfamily protein